MRIELARVRALVKLVDLFVPHSCPVCFGSSSRSDALCPNCWQSLYLLNEPRCELCGAEVRGQNARICTDCYDNPRPWHFGTSAVHYRSLGKVMVLRLKNMRAENMAYVMANIALEEHPDFFNQADILIPIPLHWRKLVLRGFNQAALLAHHLSAKTGVKMDESILFRKRATKLQMTLHSFEERKENLGGSMKLKNAHKIEGKTILLIDDVMTSGASFEAACEVLLEGKPARIGVFSFARAGVHELLQ